MKQNLRNPKTDKAVGIYVLSLEALGGSPGYDVKVIVAL